MEVKTSAFCSLSRNSDWQNFLKSTDSKLYQELVSTLNSRKGCRANSNKMIEIYQSLIKNGHQSELESFFKRRFPWIIKQNINNKVVQQNKSKNFKKLPTQKSRAPSNWEVLNKHRVFKSYRPDVLSFPQKLIIVDDPQVLFDRVQDFIKDKLGIDYVIIENHAYIEYFEVKYSSVIDKIPRQSRDIHQYRLKLNESE